MKILWASPNSLLDSASGSALSVRQMLRQLAGRGWQVLILSATVTVHPNGAAAFSGVRDALRDKLGQFITVQEPPLQHRLLVTRSLHRRLMHAFEETLWLQEYERLLEREQPDVVFFYDQSLLSKATAEEAKVRGIPAVCYLAHANATGQSWCRHVSEILTDSRSTAELYAAREGYALTPVGTFIDPHAYQARAHQPQHLLVINPSPAKGGLLVAQLALALERSRPDIRFEVVESRSDWSQLVRLLTRRMGDERQALSNVICTPNQRDMRPVYGRARLLLMPSLWWESSGRVVVEAMLNGIPVLASRSGGIPETLGEGGELLDLPEQAFQPPYDHLLDPDDLAAVADQIIRLVDDPDHYALMQGRARAAYTQLHNLEHSTDRLQQALQAVVVKP